MSPATTTPKDCECDICSSHTGKPLSADLRLVTREAASETLGISLHKVDSAIDCGQLVAVNIGLQDKRRHLRVTWRSVHNLKADPKKAALEALPESAIPDRVYRVAEVAQLMAVSVGWVEQAIKLGQIPAFDIGDCSKKFWRVRARSLWAFQMRRTLGV